MDTAAKKHVGAAGETIDLRSLVARALGDGVATSAAPGVRIRELCDDSRSVTTGALFVAVAGHRADGAAFVNEAAARGAAAVVVDADATINWTRPDEPRAAAERPVVIRVSDTRRALARLAATYHGLDRIQADGELGVIGVTGTNGKTTVAYMLRSLLRAAGRQVAMLGTIEYDLVGRTLCADLTTPGPVSLTRHLVEAHAAGARYAVMEASSHSLDQHRTDGIRFSAAVFTNLTQDHLDYHRTPEDYLRSKRRLFEGLSGDAFAVVNTEDAAGQHVTEGCRVRILRYGEAASADVRGQWVEPRGRGGRRGSVFMLEYDGRRIEVHTQLVGRHNFMNGLAAAAAGVGMGLDAAAIQHGLGSLAFVPGRLQRVDAAGLGFDVFVDYAHTDDALRNVLRAARPLTRGRLWCVFGCGGDRDRSKRPLMARAVADGADAFIITSDNPRTEDPLAIIADIEGGLTARDRDRTMTMPDRAEAIIEAVGRLSQGDTLVIAGKGHEDYQILGSEKVHFDDVEVARSAIQRRQVGCGR